MRIIVTLALALAIMAGLVFAIVAVSTAATAGARAVSERTPVTAGTLAKVSYAVLWCLVAGVSAGLIGGA